MESVSGEAIRRRAVAAAHELLISARYRQSYVYGRPGAYFVEVERLKKDVEAIAGWRVVFPPYAELPDKSLRRSVGRLAYVLESVRHYMDALNVELYALEVVEHRAIFKDVEACLHHAVIDE